jgi:hypothetical protein
MSPPGVPLPGAIELPDGTWVRGRSVRRPPTAGPEPTLGLYLGVDYHPPWQHQHIRWPDFWLPTDPEHALELLRAAHRHARDGGRLEIGCRGGQGRTGTAIAALAVLVGVPPDHAVAWVRRHYAPRAVETPWQRRWVRRLPAAR